MDRTQAPARLEQGSFGKYLGQTAQEKGHGRPGVSVRQFNVHFPLGQSEKLLCPGLGLQVLSILVVGELPYLQ